MRFITHRPILLSHMITPRCNTKCVLCPNWQIETETEMTTKEIFQILDMAKKEGMIDYSLWGGEPLIRKDLPEVLAYTKEIGLDTTVITNGLELPEKIPEIGDNLSNLIVSIDYADPEQHDESRRQKGVFDSAIQGIEEARIKYRHINLFINCVLCNENLNQLREISELARKEKVKIMFEMMREFPGYNEEYALKREEIIYASHTLLQLKREGYPIVNSPSYFKLLLNGQSYSCHEPKVLATVDWNGNLITCSRFKNAKIGNVLKEGFSNLFKSKKYQFYVKTAEKCSECFLSYPYEISSFWDFNIETILNFGKNLLSQYGTNW